MCIRDSGIQLDAEIDYRDLVKLMIGGDEGNSAKAEVVIRDAEVRDGVLLGHAYAHPKLGEGPIRSSAIISISYDEEQLRILKRKIRFMLLAQPVGRKFRMTTPSTTWTITSTRFKALGRVSATAHTFPLLILMVFQVISTAIFCCCVGKWVTVTNGGT